MKKKILATIIASLLLCFSFGINIAVADTCSGMHSNYYNGVISTGNWSSSHKVYTGAYDSNNKPIYYWCSYDAEGVTYNVYCGVCHTKVSGPYSYENTYNHSCIYCPQY